MVNVYKPFSYQLNLFVSHLTESHMKVVLLTSYFPPHVGGVEVHVERVAHHLHKRGFEVVVVTSSASGTAEFPFEVKYVPCIPIPYSPITPFLGRFLEKLDGDIFHSHTPPPFFSYSLKKSPHVITYHCDIEIPEKYGMFPIPKTVSRLIIKKSDDMLSKALDRADAIVATTKSYAETSRLLNGRHYHVIPNGIELSEFEGVEAEKEPIVLFLGRLAATKGVDVLLRAMKHVDVEARCVIIGDGEERNSLERLARELNVNAEFTGFLPRRKVIEYLARASLLVLPSLSRLEAFGIVLLEAMACGTPVAASDLPGVRDVAREAGLVFPPGDHIRLGEIINEVLSDEEKIRMIGNKGKKVVREKYSWKVIVDSLVKLYESLV